MLAKDCKKGARVKMVGADALASYPWLAGLTLKITGVQRGAINYPVETKVVSRGEKHGWDAVFNRNELKLVRRAPTEKGRVRR